MMLAEFGSQSPISRELFNRAYSIALQNSTIIDGIGIPKFEELYEEYVSLIIEMKVQMSPDRIQEELEFLRRWDELDVEHGFIPHENGVQKEAELFNYMIENQFGFMLNNEIFGIPLESAW